MEYLQSLGLTGLKIITNEVRLKFETYKYFK